MNSRGELRIDPNTLDGNGTHAELEVVVPYTEPSLAEAALQRVATLTSGLNARVTLVAIHTVPYPSEFICPASAHAYLVEQLMNLASHCPIPVQPQVVLARDREEGFRFALKPQSTILVGTRRHFWRTAEEGLARALARDGHTVALVHVA